MTKPRAACLIGWPAAHSRSPLIHHYWLRTLGIEGGYNIEAVPPEGFADFVLHLSSHGFVGANVTIPHKERALALSTPDPRARAVGAANTLWYDNHELRSTNTDIEGFINNLDACAPGWDAATDALVLGAGGSSRAVVFGLIERGIKRVHLANRSIARARLLADQFGACVDPVEWDAVDDLLPSAGLLVNTTSLGMHGQPALEIDVGRLPAAAVVADLVYVPLETALLSAAQARRLRTADGLGMLLHQAVHGFELWFGQRPRVTPELRRWSRPISQKLERGNVVAASVSVGGWCHRRPVHARLSLEPPTPAARRCDVRRILAGGDRQQTSPVRVRGTIESIDGPMLTIKSREGADLKVRLTDNVVVIGVAKTELSEIKEGSYIGVAAMPEPDGTQKALAVPFTRKPSAAPPKIPALGSSSNSTMTNATVADTVAGTDGQNILVKYKDGEKKVVVPPGTPIVAFVAGERSQLKPGAKFIIFGAARKDDGTLETGRIAVGLDGITPPM